MHQNPIFSILLLTYNGQRLIEDRLNELLPLYGARDDVEILVLDNGSTDGTMLALASVALTNPGGPTFSAERIDKNVGFGPGFNLMAERAIGDILVFHSNDVRVSDDFLDPVREALAGDPGAIICHRVVDWKAGWNTFDDQHFPYPEGYFLAVMRGTWRALGGFDPQFAPVCYEDVDLGYRAREHGFPIRAIPSLPLFHIGAQTVGYSGDRYDHSCAMRALFAAKHGLSNIPERP